MTNETSNVVADPSRCRISYHRKEGSVGNTGTDQNYEFSLREVRQVVVLPYAQANNEWNAKNGHPNNITTSTNPPATELSVRRPHGEENCFYFTDEALANRLAKAFTHAAELCGGGNKDPF
jgi:hypothetical protein